MATQTVLICQNRSCRKAGSAKVLAAFQAELLSLAALSPADIQIIGSACLGQCGNGPMVLVMPEQVWYHRIQAEEVPAIVQRHLKEGQWVKPLLYPKFHLV